MNRVHTGGDNGSIEARIATGNKSDAAKVLRTSLETSGSLGNNRFLRESPGPENLNMGETGSAVEKDPFVEVERREMVEVKLEELEELEEVEGVYCEEDE